MNNIISVYGIFVNKSIATYYTVETHVSSQNFD